LSSNKIVSCGATGRLFLRAVGLNTGKNLEGKGRAHTTNHNASTLSNRGSEN